MTILITGASGFIGGFVAKQLSKQSGNQIVATGRSHTDQFKSYTNIEYVRMDLSEELPEISCDVCIHAAGLADDKATPQQFNRSNVHATCNLIQALSGCKVFIYISSSSVYDFGDGKVKVESDANLSATISHYGRSKLIGEVVVLGSCIPSLYILRPRAVYGPGDRVLLPRIFKLIRRKKILVPGNMKARSSMTNVYNLFEAILTCIKKSKSGICTCNIADSDVYRLKDVFSELSYNKYGHRNFIHIPIFIINVILTITNLLGIKSVITRQSLNYLTQDSILSIKKAREHLDYSPSREFFTSQYE